MRWDWYSGVLNKLSSDDNRQRPHVRDRSIESDLLFEIFWHGKQPSCVSGSYNRHLDKWTVFWAAIGHQKQDDIFQ